VIEPSKTKALEFHATVATSHMQRDLRIILNG
jgi:hypothetical protein